MHFGRSARGRRVYGRHVSDTLGYCGVSALGLEMLRPRAESICMSGILTMELKGMIGAAQMACQPQDRLALRCSQPLGEPLVYWYDCCYSEARDSGNVEEVCNMLEACSCQVCSVVFAG